MILFSNVDLYQNTVAAGENSDTEMITSLRVVNYKTRISVQLSTDIDTVSSHKVHKHEPRQAVASSCSKSQPCKQLTLSLVTKSHWKEEPIV